MSVLESVLNNKFSLRYYGLNDVATSLHATSLLQKDQLIIEYFSVSSLLIKFEEDFRDYLTLITITKYQEVVGSLKKESVRLHILL